MNRKLLITGSIFGMLSVILGAFAAHGLESLIEPDKIASFNTGVRYQMYHAILLLFVGMTGSIPQQVKRLLFYSIITGIVMFSGSIYGLATNDLTAFDFKIFGIITPIGGLILILSRAYMLLTFMRNTAHKN